MVLPLHIFEQRYRDLVQDLLAQAETGSPAVFGVVAIRAGQEVGEDAATALAQIGCLADLRAVGSLPDGRFEIVAVGTTRFRLERVIATETPYLQAKVQWIDEASGPEAQALAEQARAAFESYRAALRGTSEDAEPADLPQDPTMLSYALGSAVVLTPADRQGIVAAADTDDRLRLLLRLMARERAVLGQLRAVPTHDFLRTGMSPN